MNTAYASQKITELESRIRLITSKYAHDPLEADDIFQSVCEKLLTQIKEGDTDAMILTRARWRAAHYREAERVYSVYMGSESDIAATEDEGADAFEYYCPDQSRSTEDEVASREELAAINAAVQKMSAENQKIVALLAAGYNKREISKKLGVTRSAITQRVNGIEKLLRLELALDFA